MQFDVQSARENLKLQRFDLAATQYQELIANSPTDFILYLELSSALMGLQKLDEALVVVKQLEHVDFKLPEEVQLQKANINLAQGRFAESIPILQSLILSSCHERARTALSSAYLGVGLPTKASALFNGIEEEKLSPGDVNNLAISLCEQIQTPKALDLLSKRIINKQFDNSTISNLLMLSNYHASPENYISTAKKEIRKVNQEENVMAINKKSTDNIRVGFISGDMYQHPVGWFFIGLLKELSESFSTTIFYTNSKTDQLTHDLIAAASDFYFVEHLADVDLIQKIQAAQIDVLIDLSGHTANNRLSIFNQRIAPIQLSYLGYFASTYMSKMDGVIFDQWHLTGVPDGVFSERIHHLPCSRFCYTPPPYIPQITALPAIANGIITFCSFSSTSKISNECIEMWAKTLEAIPESRIQLRWRTLRDSQLRDHIRKLFLSHGIPNSRVELYPDCDHESLFHFYNEVDIALDTYPFSGATTSCEALSMGVPVITRTGKSPASNQTASILNELHLNECIANDISEFVEQAKKLSSDIERLSNWRSTMRERIASSALGNPKLFTSHFSQLITEIYHEGQ
ncbi:O-linked N-acetylglucosamine transferase family protein [Polynucleobacter arcticus]|uniref:O-GlcNAc transferase C-terminal domain-containing protein n=1 Tax=Polynucleobacter arcticus TaxID=1743165 RepID=A0A6M9PLW8_9BURK|nr:hypothetical protein [Polynucleobacter arcticus]QKM60932.1 hypothetical protein DN92_07790 [Polynucleobacter arcticus]